MELIDKYMWYQEGPGVRKNQYTSSGVKLLNVANLVEGKIELSTSSRYISEDEANGRYNHFLVDEGDLIIASSGIQVSYFEKKMGIAEKKHLPLCMNTSTIRFKVLDKNITDIRYFMYFLKSNVFKKQIRKLITGSAQLNFGPSHLKKIKIEMPELKKQQEIVKKLDRVKKIIDIRNNQIIELNELIKSQFVEMFELEKYELEMLGGISNFIDYRGKTPTISDDKEVRIINAKSVGKGFFKYIDEYITEDLYEKWMKRGIAYAGDVLFVTEGHTFGNTCLIPDGIERFALGQRVITIQGKEKLNNIYLCYYMQLDEFINKINIYKTGGTAKGIRSKDLAKITIPIPPITLQNEFSEIVKQIDKQKFEIEKSLKEIQELYESLMQEYFAKSTLKNE